MGFLNITGAGGDDEITIDPWADNTVGGWGIAVTVDGGLGNDHVVYGNIERDETNQPGIVFADNTPNGSRSSVSENAVLAPSGTMGGGQLRVTNATNASNIVTLDFTTVEDVSFFFNDTSMGDVDTLMIEGTATADTVTANFTNTGLTIAATTNAISGAGAAGTELIDIVGATQLVQVQALARATAGTAGTAPILSALPAVSFALGDGDDTFIFTGKDNTQNTLAPTTVNVDLGNPSASDTLILTGTNSADDAYAITPGANSQAGTAVVTLAVSPASTVNYSNTEAITINGGGGTGQDVITLNGTGAANAFTLTATASLAAGSARVDAGPMISFSNLGVGAGPTNTSDIVLNGHGGADAFAVHYATGWLIDDVTIDGGAPATHAGDEITLNLAGQAATTLDLTTAPRAGNFNINGTATDLIYSDIERVDTQNGTYSINTITGTGNADTFTVKREGGDIVVRLDANDLFRGQLADLTGVLQIDGGDGNDVLVIDMSGGNPIPAGGLTFNGQDPTTASGDSIQIIGGSANSITYTPSSTPQGSGTANIDGSLLTFTGLEPLLVTTTTENVIIDMSALTAAETVTLEDDGTANNGRSRVNFTTATLEDITFANPTKLLRVIGTGLADTITINAIDGSFNADLTVDAGAGGDAINYNARTGSGRYQLNGGADTDTLLGTNTGHVWNITAANAGNLDAAGVNDFTGIENLTGGAGNDVFVIGSGGTLSGAIAGGTTGTDTLQQADGTNAWSISGAGSGIVTDTGGFSDIENIVGGSGVDMFSFTGGTLTGTVDGGSGNDSITGAANYSITGTNSGTLTGAVGFVNVENLSGSGSFTFTSAGSLSGTVTGTGGSDTIVGADDGNVFTVSAANAGMLVGKVSGFTGFENLTGGGGADRFAFIAGGVVSGSLDGGAGGDTLDYSALSAALSVTMTSTGDVTGALGVSGSITNLENIIGSSAADTFIVAPLASLQRSIDGGNPATALR